MKNIKKILCAAVLSCTLINPVSVSAYDYVPTLSVVEESKNNINLKVEDTNTIVKSFQITLNVSGAKVSSINWSENIINNASADYILNNDVVTIYVSSKVNLLDEEGVLNIGTLKVTGNDGDEYSILPQNMKLVSLNNKTVAADTVDYEGKEIFSVSQRAEEPVIPETPESPAGDKDDTSSEDKNEGGSIEDGGIIDNMPKDDNIADDKDEVNKETSDGKDTIFDKVAVTYDNMKGYSFTIIAIASVVTAIFSRKKFVKKYKH